MRPLQRFCWVFRGRRRRLSATSLLTGNNREVASAGAVRLSETAAHAPDLLDRPVHDRLRRRFRPAVPARARRAARAAAARSAVRIGRSRRPPSCSRSAGWPRRCFISGGRSGHGAPFRNGARPGCRARACCRSRPRSRRRSSAIGWVFFGASAGFVGLCGVARRRARGGHDLLHRHDLRLAEADPSMAQPLDRAELFCPRR